MLRIQAALGPEVFLYGEGWSMGELAADARAELSASQTQMAGSGIGTFNDRFRDAVRGGGPFDCGVLLYQQSPVNGLWLDDNARGGLLQATKEGAACDDAQAFEDAGSERKQQLFFQLQDRLRVGLAGSLRDYHLIDHKGQKTRSGSIDYFGQSAGYAEQPREILNYVENHDNQTLWDIMQLKLPYVASMQDRVRVHNLALSLNMLAMGVPYFTAGAELLRSKSLVRDSFNAGDWFNQIDFSGQRSNWNAGLPLALGEERNLSVMQDLLKAVPEGPSPTAIRESTQHFQELLCCRNPFFVAQIQVIQSSTITVS
jgi:pullulanase/glycogen debranching enzyme